MEKLLEIQKKMFFKTPSITPGHQK
jgi:hypothetical protein